MYQLPARPPNPSRCVLVCLVLSWIGAAWAPLALAVAPNEESEPALGTRAAFTTPALHVEPSTEMRSRAELAHDTALQAFFADYSDRWEIQWDLRSDRPNLIQGAGIPVIPGRGNDLKASDVGFAGPGLGSEDTQPTVAQVEAAVRGFLRTNDVLRIDGFDLVLDESSSEVSGRDRHFWNIELQQVHDGVPVHDAKAFFRINHGNIVQLGTKNLAPVLLSAEPSVALRRAFADGLAEVGVDRASVELGEQELVIYPTMSRSEARGERYRGAVGDGYQHVLVWRFTFVPVGDNRQHQLLVDAHTGEVLELVDLTAYAKVEGHVYDEHYTTDVEVGMPYMTVSIDGIPSTYTNANGNYGYFGGLATVTLDGRYTAINDDCGSSPIGSSGNIDLGWASSTDCGTPNFAGNTNASRTAYYYLTTMNRKAATYEPNKAWLNGTLTANTNIQNSCNAFWSGSTVNFYRKGGDCANTGEIADVVIHEWGHGMDVNSGGWPGEHGSFEAAADIFAFLETRDGCMGDGWNTDNDHCWNCNDDCSGVRDVAAFAEGGSSTIARPANVEADGGPNCGRSPCPYVSSSSGNPYQGPMGYQGHCESYIASTSVWDLTESLTEAYGNDAGWDAAENLWYSTVNAQGSAYRVTSGGQCNPDASVDGCGSDNWYTIFLAADDDDGDLSNGTPNGCRIYDAFRAHQIECGSRPACSGIEPRFGSVTTDDSARTVSLTDGFDRPVVAIGAPSRQGGDPGVMQISNSGPSGFTHQFREWQYLDGNHVDERADYLVVEVGSSTFAGLQVDASWELAVPPTSSLYSWQTVSFSESFASPPVVLATIASRFTGATTVARIRNVGTSSFELLVQWEELVEAIGGPSGGTHPFELVHWIAIEQGTGTLADGRSVFVGSTPNSVEQVWETISFPGTYSNPFWLGGSQTFNGADTASVRYRNLTSAGVEVFIEEEQSYDSETGHATEVIGYVVIGD